MSGLYRVLQKLSDGRFHSGEDLAGQLGVTRTCVWKQIHQLQQEYGLDIQAIRGRGYRLSEALELLVAEKISAQLPKGKSDGLFTLETYLSVPSTNQYLLDMVRQGQRQPRIVFAEHQSAGRGRRGRHWISPPGGNLYFSILRVFESMPAIEGLSLTMAVAVARVLEQMGLADINIKWPNDIVIGGKKLCGILLEAQGEVNGPCVMVIGIGLNVRMPPGAGVKVDQPWTDLYTLLGGPISRNQLAAALLGEIVPVLDLSPTARGEYWQDAWPKFDCLRGHSVRVTTTMGDVHGVASGVDNSGALLVEQDGHLQRYTSGEVSLRLTKHSTD